jgi:choline dehydrogenase
MIEKFYTTRQTLGGSSSSNAMLYVRGQQNDYDHWHSLGNPGWSFNDLIPPPYFRAFEHQERGPNDFCGINGTLNVADSTSKPAINENFMQSVIAAGYPENHNFNGASQEGISYTNLTNYLIIFTG